jgi:hypothetical protein
VPAPAAPGVAVLDDVRAQRSSNARTPSPLHVVPVSAPDPQAVSAATMTPGSAPYVSITLASAADQAGPDSDPMPTAPAPPLADLVPSLASDPPATLVSASDPVLGSSTYDASLVPAPTAPRTHLQAGICKPKVYSNSTVWYAFCTTSGEPHSLQEALSTPSWKAAMNEEYTALIRNKTWHLVPPQAGQNVIDCKWVYKVKHKVDGSVDRHKAHLVPKGF